MWAAIIGFLLQLALELIKAWFRNRDGGDEAEAKAVKLAEDALRTGDSRPLRDFIAELRAKRRAKKD